ncbi:MAG TPA: molybdate ABC transporter substrate-binding protein [Tepidisphaeraceae bacterium]|nr:molybdate ABC transporter substrate-binding protein [Tepidisphaeraceae bacterium]
MLLLTTLATAASALAQDRLTVSAAISLKPALEAMRGDYERATGDPVSFNFAASGALLAQIKAGAPVDVFISAADRQVDEMLRDGLGDPATRVVVARNQLVLIVPVDGGPAITSLADLATDRVRRLAAGQPKTVPAGDYAAQALAASGLTAAVRDKLVYGNNVRQVLDYVARGEVDAGLVYAMDANDARERVRSIAAVDPSLHEPIVYPAAIVTATPRRAAAERFLAYLTAEPGRRALRDKGFEVPPAPASPTTASTTSPAPTTVPAR